MSPTTMLRTLSLGILLCAVTHHACAQTTPRVMSVPIEEPRLRLPAVEAKLPCETMSRPEIAQSLSLPVSIVSSKRIEESGRLPYCKIDGYIAPQIRFELQLPTRGWTQRYLQIGCGGYCGVVGLAEPPVLFGLPAAPVFPWSMDPHVAGSLLGGAFVNGEIARATTDGGHIAPILDTLWARDNLPAQVDWGYRAVHEVAIAAKEIIGRFYGRPPAYSYFYGLSDGGREALMEAQRYPGDFAGIVADAPAFLSSTLNGILQPWVAGANLDEQGRYILTPEKVRVLHAAVIAACDKLDGLADHLIEDPRACTFNPSTLECPGAHDRPDCLTHAQVEAARKLYQPPQDGAGHVLYPGAMPYGSEAAWDFEITAAPGVPAIAPSLGGFRRDFAQDVDPTSSMRSWRIDLAEMRALRERQGPIIDAADPDLRAFQARSGKLILIQGWADQAVVPMGTIAYWHAIGTTMGGDAMRDAFTRLFMLPGVTHGRGLIPSDGPSYGDFVTPVMDWVESGIAPERLTVYSTAGPPMQSPVTRSRPVFPYPKVARYTGTGNPDDAANFAPADPPVRYPDIVAGWADSFVSGYEKVCAWQGSDFRCRKGK